MLSADAVLSVVTGRRFVVLAVLGGLFGVVLAALGLMLLSIPTFLFVAIGVSRFLYMCRKNVVATLKVVEDGCSCTWTQIATDVDSSGC